MRYPRSRNARTAGCQEGEASSIAISTWTADICERKDGSPAASSSLSDETERSRVTGFPPFDSQAVRSSAANSARIVGRQVQRKSRARPQRGSSAGGRRRGGG